MKFLRPICFLLIFVMISSCKVFQPNRSASDTVVYENRDGYSPETATYVVSESFTPLSDPPTYFTVYSNDHPNIYILKLEIFNRWGGLMYRDGGLGYWDGWANGVLAPQGVYHYKLVIEYPDDSVRVVQGFVNLIR